MRSPGALVDELKALAAWHPHLPILRNHLAHALNMAGLSRPAADVIAEMVRRFPTYVFGFANHVMMLLFDGKVEAARALLETGPRGPLLSLMQFDPSRTLFHATEAICYTAMSGHYLIATGRTEAAAACLKMCRQLDPDHRQTRELQQSLARVTILDRNLLGLTRARSGRPRKKAWG